MKLTCVIFTACLFLASCPAWAQASGGDRGVRTLDEIMKRLNQHSTVAGREESKSYRLIFDAYLDLTAPPMEVGPDFNQNTIHNGMPRFSAVSSWAESNTEMAQAIIDARSKNIIGLPYGLENVPSTYRQHGIYVQVGSGGRLQNIAFEYFNALETISAFVTAEVYRRMEAGQSEEALELAMAHIYVLRQFCDRDFLAEKLHHIQMLSDALRNLRDVFYVYLDQIPSEAFKRIAIREIPFLRPDRSRLFMPEADRIVSEVRIREVFDDVRGEVDPESFARTFAAIQAQNRPMIRFGATKRWEIVATVHGSLDSTLERLQLIYDDWWRRWRIDSYDPILELETEFERCNTVRYAAVLFSVADIENLFSIRNQLIAETNGTAIAAGLCGYQRTFNTFPRQMAMIYAVTARKRSDSDPHDLYLQAFRYRKASQREAINTPSGRIWVESGIGLLYSVGQDHIDNRASDHTDDGFSGDVVLWPPVKALLRKSGQID